MEVRLQFEMLRLERTKWLFCFTHVIDAFHSIGNVSVQKVDAEFGNVYLLLEGACGSCASSTVTMKMGIERVLKEKFGSKINDVIQVDPEESLGGDKPTELSIEAVQAEVKRLSQAITAMGGVVRVVSVDPIGVVEVEFRGPNKVKKGLELALLDIEFVKHVNFVSEG
jgi:Fe-S cluster biogenesis protein NfuA